MNKVGKFVKITLIFLNKCDDLRNEILTDLEPGGLIIQVQLLKLKF